MNNSKLEIYTKPVVERFPPRRPEITTVTTAFKLFNYTYQYGQFEKTTSSEIFERFLKPLKTLRQGNH